MSSSTPSPSSWELPEPGGVPKKLLEAHQPPGRHLPAAIIQATSPPQRQPELPLPLTWTPCPGAHLHQHHAPNIILNTGATQGLAGQPYCSSSSPRPNNTSVTTRPCTTSWILRLWTTPSPTKSITWAQSTLRTRIQGPGHPTQITQWTPTRHQGPCRLERTGSGMGETPRTTPT